MKIDGVIWFTQGIGSFGIVYGKDDHTNERKAYIGTVEGLNEEDDIEDIKQNGTKLLPEQAKEISDFLNA